MDEAGRARRAAGASGVALAMGVVALFAPVAAVIGIPVAVGAVVSAIRSRDEATHGELAAAIGLAAGAVFLCAVVLVGAALQPLIASVAERTMRATVAPAVERQHGQRMLADVRTASGSECAPRITAVHVVEAFTDHEGRRAAARADGVARAHAAVTLDSLQIPVTLLRVDPLEREWIVTDGVDALAAACG